MPIRKDLSSLNCSLAKALDIVGDGWTMLIIRDLFLGATRFADFASSLGIARNILTDRLARLTDAGLVAREGTENRPVYQLTDKGYDLIPALVALLQWGDRWFAKDGKPMLITDRSDTEIPPMILRDLSGMPIAPRNISITPGPGADPRTRGYIDMLATRDQ